MMTPCGVTLVFMIIIDDSMVINQTTLPLALSLFFKNFIFPEGHMELTAQALEQDQMAPVRGWEGLRFAAD